MGIMIGAPLYFKTITAQSRVLPDMWRLYSNSPEPEPGHLDIPDDGQSMLSKQKQSETMSRSCPV